MKKEYSNEEIAIKYYEMIIMKMNEKLEVNEEEIERNDKISELIKYLEISRGKKEKMTENELKEFITQMENDLDKMDELTKEDEKRIEQIEKHFPENIKTLRI